MELKFVILCVTILVIASVVLAVWLSSQNIGLNLQDYGLKFEITEKDNGKTFTYGIGSKFIVELDPAKYPKENVSCEPAGVVGGLSELPLKEPSLYALKFQALNPGACRLGTGDFKVTIKVWGLD